MESFNWNIISTLAVFGVIFHVRCWVCSSYFNWSAASRVFTSERENAGKIVLTAQRNVLQDAAHNGVMENVVAKIIGPMETDNNEKGSTRNQKPVRLMPWDSSLTGYFITPQTCSSLTVTHIVIARELEMGSTW